ncbi:hypothetical protein ACUNWD_07055 [Sunxiuqinia sp. A32]|uniref:hypothetical protein n=1 Tax=Sunxiuqinia sp. A32 TaxID=3461496 RepID=UPI004045B749
MLVKVTSMYLAFWAGFVSSISFLEAWLKFRADGVTREIGLSIGSLVFTVLNRIELAVLSIGWGFFYLLYRRNLLKRPALIRLFGLITIILMSQTFWLLPQLLQRAEQIIAGYEPADSPVHLIFILFEAVKLILLITLSIKVLNSSEKVSSKL